MSTRRRNELSSYPWDVPLSRKALKDQFDVMQKAQVVAIKKPRWRVGWGRPGVELFPNTESLYPIIATLKVSGVHQQQLNDPINRDISKMNINQLNMNALNATNKYMQ